MPRSSPPAIKGIIFDAFDTLLKPRSPPYLQYAEEARKFGFQFRDQDLKHAFSQAFKQTSSSYPLYGLYSSPQLQSPDEWWAKLIQTTFSNSILRIPSHDLSNQLPILTARLLERFGSQEAYQLFPEVESSLEQLSSITFDLDEPGIDRRPIQAEKLRLSLATNSDSRILHAMKDLGLDRFLNLSIPDSASVLPPAAISLPMVSRSIQEAQSSLFQRPSDSAKALTVAQSEVGQVTLSYFEGFEKPHPDFFKIASKRLFQDLGESDLNSIAYVGDQLREDYFGARKAGLRAFWLRRRGENDRSQPEIDLTEVDKDFDWREIQRDTVDSLETVVDRIRLINGNR